jgi:hypothetical protein
MVVVVEMFPARYGSFEKMQMSKTVNNKVLKRAYCQEQKIVSICLHRFIMNLMSCCTDGLKPGLIFRVVVVVGVGVGVSIGVDVSLQSVHELISQRFALKYRYI